MGNPLRLLIVDNSKADADLMLAFVRSGNYEPVYQVVDSEPAMRAALESQEWDLITSDHRMPVFSAPAALAVAFEVRPNLPFIVVSAENNLNLAVSLMRAGAQDYIQKEEMDRLVPTITRVLRENLLREQRREIARALQISEASYRQHFETAQEGILILDAETAQIRDLNPFLTNLLGYSREQCFGKKLWEIGAFKDSVASQAEFVELKTRGYIRYENLPLKTSDGRAIDVECIGNLYVVNNLRVIQCYIRVITDRVAADVKSRGQIASLELGVQERTAEIVGLHREADTLQLFISQRLSAPLQRIESLAELWRMRYANKVDSECLGLFQNLVAATAQIRILIEGMFGLPGRWLA